MKAEEKKIDRQIDMINIDMTTIVVSSLIQYESTPGCIPQLLKI